MSIVGVIAPLASQRIGPRPDDDERDEQEHVRSADAVANARTTPVGARDQRGGPFVASHSVLHDRVARMYASENSARNAASMRLSAVAIP